MASSTGAGVSSAEGGSGAACAVCEGIQSRIQTYLQEVRALQDTPVEGYDANFERMRVTTHLMRQTNDVSNEALVNKAGYTAQDAPSMRSFHLRK